MMIRKDRGYCKNLQKDHRGSLNRILCLQLGVKFVVPPWEPLCGEYGKRFCRCWCIGDRDLNAMRALESVDAS